MFDRRVDPRLQRPSRVIFLSPFGFVLVLLTRTAPLPSPNPTPSPYQNLPEGNQPTPAAMWHEARKSERKVHDLMDAARRRAQRRAAYLARRRGDPHQSLQVSGARCRVHRDDALYQATEYQQ